MRTIVEEGQRNMVIMDVFSKLIQKRIIFIDGSIDEELSNQVIAQMLYLDSIGQKEINIYINSYGGSVLDGLAIYDTAKLLNSPIRTVCVGKACSMGFLLMLMGQTRCATKNARLMIHSLSGGNYGTLEDMKITYEEVSKLQEILNNIILENTKLTNLEEYLKFDKWMGSEEALELGVITEIL